jgi:mannose-6-phosphate isomerase-like protein (cupin superfamily)
MSTDWMFSLADVRDSLPKDPSIMRFTYALRHGSMKMGLYAPDGEDTQVPHNQDELYLIASGSGEFL